MVINDLDMYILREAMVLLRYCLRWNLSDRQAIELGFAQRYAERHPR